MRISHVGTLAICLLASAGRAIAAASFTEDAFCAVQSATTAKGHLTVEDKERNAKGKGKNPVADDPEYCAGQVLMDMNRVVVSSNLGGLGPDFGADPVVHIQPFVDLVDGRTADLVVSNLSEYSAINVDKNGLNGEFNNINIIAGSVDLLFTFLDTATQQPLAMPPFNLTIYDLDGPLADFYAETVSIVTDDFDYYELTKTTDVVATVTGDKTNFGSSSWGLLCDNPSSIATVGISNCQTGYLDQKDRGVAVQMKGGKHEYHISLKASSVAQKGRNFLFGVPAYFDVVCHAPTLSPTPAPTPPPSESPTASPTVSRTRGGTSLQTAPYTLPPDVATSFGDPHVSNLKGERFDILQADYHTFLVIPRGADEEHALLHVVAKIDPLGPLCSGWLYVTSLRFSGRWVGDVGSLEFATTVDAAMDVEKAMKIKAGASSYLNISQFKEAVSQSLAELTVFQPQEPQSLNQHVDLLLVKLKLGPSIAKVRMVYQKVKVGFSNSLWLTTTGMGRVHEEIGGILGFDNHTFAASKPENCVDAASELLKVPHGFVRASASFEDVDF